VKGDAAAKTVTVTLRKGVKFHDGTDFNAEAVKWNIEGQMAIDRSEVRKITSIDVLDDYTLQINLSEYDNGLEFAFVSYIGVMVSPTYFETHGGEEGVKNYPVGTGPFKFVSFKRDVSLKYERFDGYWQEGKPYLDGVEFIYVADPMVSLASFQAGEGDVLLGLEPRDAASLEASGDYVFSTCMGSLCGLAGDGSHPESPFADIRVRQAIEYALDREPVVDAIGLGYWGATDQPCGKETWGYNPTPSPYSHDPQKAKELLAEAGYPDGLGVPLIVRNTPSTWVDLYTAILAQLNDAGFGLTLEVKDPAGFNEHVIVRGWDNALLGWNFSENPDSSRTLCLGFSSFGFPYRSPYYPPETDEVINQITATDDFEVKKELTQKANALIRDKYANITTICSTTNIAARYAYVHDDGLFTTVSRIATLEDAWMEK